MSEEIFNKKVDEKVGDIFGIEELGGGDVPMYRMVGASKLPISEHEGELWKERLKNSKNINKEYEDEWERNINIYNNIVTAKKEDGLKTDRKRLNSVGSAYENLIWSNTVGTLPELFAQNPKITITDLKKNDDASQEVTSMLQSLMDSIMNKRGVSSLGLKSKAKKGILNALLTNRGIIKLGWVDKIDSNEYAIEELAKLSKELENAKDTKTIKEIEGKIKALEDVIDLTFPTGPSIKMISPFNLFVDPTSFNEDASDANWIIERDWISTEYLQAKFARKDKDGNLKSVFAPQENFVAKPTETDKKLNAMNNDNNDDLKIVDDSVAKHYNCTEVYWVYDKVKKRVLLYAQDNWKFPIWTWEDTLKLDSFFPYYILSFYSNPKDSMADGEVNYYISIQNEINAINNEKSKIRSRAFNSIIYDNTVLSQSDLDKLNSSKAGFYGLKLPPDKKIQDVIAPMPTPSMNMPQIFDKSDLYSILNKISSADAQTRGEEFKTNTTNGAIETYQMSKGVKVGEKRDIIEEWIACICWGILQLCLSKFTKEDVIKYIGEEKAQSWFDVPLKPSEIEGSFSLQVVGETTVKPTSQVKKQQALQISQILGQFASATPTVALVMLRILSKAFDEASISKEDWEFIMKGIQMQMAMQAAQINQLNSQATAQQAQSVPTQPATNEPKTLDDVVAAAAGS